MPTYADKVQEQVDRLMRGEMEVIEAASLEKRLAWLKAHGGVPNPAQPVTPRQAFERLFFEYMGLAPTDLAVVEESAEKIVWRSANPCPTLDACIQLGLDTRIVCRTAVERSTQAFVASLNPRLRFGRSYTEIRPHAPFCLEWIVVVEDAPDPP